MSGQIAVFSSNNTTGNSLKRSIRLGKYRLSRILGKGGYCEVWKARDTVEGIWVAVKIPLADVNGKRDNQSLLREIRLVARLRHQNIMPVKNANIINGHAVLATELSDKTLDDCHRPMGPKRTVSIVTDVLRGLSYAHHKKIVHCDVTPGNIFLLPNGQAAIGDFGIGLQVKGRMRTIDEYGTPGYVAPEQAYGKPTYRSDCFAIALILYEFLTGYLPRWPFKWPMRGVDRLRAKTNANFVNFMKRALSVEPLKRYTNASRMLVAMQDALPKPLKARQSQQMPSYNKKKQTWQQIRTEAFLRRYQKILGAIHKCSSCGEPICESMKICPWCGTSKNRFDSTTILSHICDRCHKGILPQWSYCPWCYGQGYQPQEHLKSNHVNYITRCRHCTGKIARFMRYCPWCNRKIQKPWVVQPFPEVCSKCGWSVDSNYWHYCPWCSQSLFQ